MLTFAKWLIALLLLLSIMAAGVFFYTKHWVEQFSTSKQPLITTQLFSVVKGDNSRHVLKRLVKLGLVDNEFGYRLLLLQYPQLAKLKIGRYRLQDGMTPIALFSLLSSGVEAQFSITLVEGTSFAQWLETLGGNEHIVVDPVADYDRFKDQYVINDPKYPNAAFEGMFFPDTYHFSDQSNSESILLRANVRLKEVLAKHWKKRQKNLPLKSAYEALILASIIEKETAVPSERETIASVFVNRLRKGMRLQTDPTVIYGAGAQYAGDITRAHLRDRNSYNTYKINGLPPTPIAMVSEQAIIAALNPSETKYLYFVAAGDGGHYFSTSLAEHNRALRRYLALTK